MIRALAFLLMTTSAMAQNAESPPFKITWPETFVMKPLRNGYQVRDGRMIRNPLSVVIVIDQENSDSPNRTETFEKHVAGFEQPFTYQIIENTGGSGGNMFTLLATGQDNNGLPLYMSAQLQSEWGTVSFEDAWEILATYQPR